MSAYRVLLVGPLPPPAGGMANQTRQLQRLLEAEGLVVSIVQTNAPYRPRWIGHVRGLRALFRLGPYCWRLLRDSPRVDVVHVMANSGLSWDLFAAPAVAIAKRARRKVVVNYRGGLAREFLAAASPRVRRLLSGVRLVVPSGFLEAVFAEHGIGATVIPNVVDIELFHPRPEPRAEHRRPPHVVIARNLEHIYGIDLGLRAMALAREEVPGLHVSIAGTGPARPALEQLAAELGLRDAVTFTGQLGGAEMAQLYRSADVVLNPVRADNTPNSVLEALASGVPVVTTAVGGVPFLVTHEQTALLAAPESPRELALQLVRALRDDALRARLVAQGLELARGCAWPVVKQRWFDAYGIA